MGSSPASHMERPGKIDDILGRKIDICFGHLDVNGDGTFERADVVAYAAKVVAYQNESFHSPKALRMFEVAEAIFDNVLRALGKEGDGNITPAEWRAVIGAMADDLSKFDAMFKPLAEAIWALCDRDGDGTVTADEFEGFQKALGTPQENRKIAFEMLDRDGSGNFSSEELMEDYREYYTSRDPKARGNWLYGDIWDDEVWEGTRVRLS
ncbi:EF-hand domain-containing protein [Nonomuraea insulae]|uniref:EF-hand domain-containing protein n=1 Tax=Nonomuraea insulae TaxID=1616787 RepID=A0ABW1CQV7_9ACTN